MEKLPLLNSYSQTLYKDLFTDWDEVHMAAEQYLIILHNDEWKISFKDKHYGPYKSQPDAIEAAIDGPMPWETLELRPRSWLKKQITSSELSGPTAKALTPLGKKKGGLRRCR